MDAFRNFLLSLFLVLVTVTESMAQKYPSVSDLLEIRASCMEGDRFQVSQYLKKLGYTDKLERNGFSLYFRGKPENRTLSIDANGDMLFTSHKAGSSDSDYYYREFSKVGAPIKTDPGEYIVLMPEVISAFSLIGNELKVSIQDKDDSTSPKKSKSNPGSLEIEVDDTKRTELYLKKGEQVHIKADGRISFGLFAGSGGPNGISGFTMYNIVKNYPHGCLLATIGEHGSWHKVGYETTITADQEGYLKFFVNDVDPGNNSGSYTVKCNKL